MDVDSFLAQADGLLAIPSTSDRPGDLRRALDFVLDSGGPAVTVDRFESGGKPSALVYRPGPERISVSCSTRTWTSCPLRPSSSGRAARVTGCSPAERRIWKISALLAVRVFREMAGRLPYPLGLQLVTDEEVGGRDGTRHQLECGVRGQFVIIGETSGLCIVTESKGIVSVTLMSAGAARMAPTVAR